MEMQAMTLSKNEREELVLLRAINDLYRRIELLRSVQEFGPLPDLGHYDAPPKPEPQEPDEDEEDEEDEEEEADEEAGKPHEHHEAEAELRSEFNGE